MGLAREGRGLALEREDGEPAAEELTIVSRQKTCIGVCCETCPRRPGRICSPAPPSLTCLRVCGERSLFPATFVSFPARTGWARKEGVPSLAWASGFIDLSDRMMTESVRRPDLVRPWKPHPPVGPDDLPPDLICLLSLILGLVGMLAKVLDDCVRVQWHCLLYLHALCPPA